MASLTIEKPHDMVDNRWKVSVSGLLPAQKVTLQATMEEGKMRFGSYAHFIANANGEISLDHNASLGGTYTGIDSMGLVWSMKQCPGQRSGLRFFKRDVTTPMDIILSLFPDHWAEDQLYATNPTPQPLISLVAHRWFLDDSVQRSEIKVGNIRGTMFTPPGTGPFPGVIDMFGTAGGQLEFRASVIASRGFKVLALPYLDHQDLPKAVFDLDFSYFLEAADFLSWESDVLPGIGVVGVSKGGEIALWMAVHCPQVSAVVNISGLPFYGGCPLKFGSTELPGVAYDMGKVEDGEEGYIFSNAMPFDESALIPIQKSTARVLLLAGEDDGTNPPNHLVRYMDWLPKSKRPDVELVLFPKTGHLIEPPFKPFTRASFHTLFGESVVWGGEAKAHAQSEVIAWNKLLGFLRANVGRTRNLTNSQL